MTPLINLLHPSSTASDFERLQFEIAIQCECGAYFAIDQVTSALSIIPTIVSSGHGGPSTQGDDGVGRLYVHVDETHVYRKLVRTIVRPVFRIRRRFDLVKLIHRCSSP